MRRQLQFVLSALSFLALAALVSAGRLSAVDLQPLEIVGKVLPLAPWPSRLPWAVENLRSCPWCDQLAQKDLNDCPTCGRRMGPLTGSKRHA